jgi:hypothetical protein
MKELSGRLSANFTRPITRLQNLVIVSRYDLRNNMTGCTLLLLSASKRISIAQKLWYFLEEAERIELAARFWLAAIDKILDI